MSFRMKFRIVLSLHFIFRLINQIAQISLFEIVVITGIYELKVFSLIFHSYDLLLFSLELLLLILYLFLFFFLNFHAFNELEVLISFFKPWVYRHFQVLQISHNFYTFLKMPFFCVLHSCEFDIIMRNSYIAWTIIKIQCS
jgi:hypothetical protein